MRCFWLPMLLVCLPCCFSLENCRPEGWPVIFMLYTLPGTVHAVQLGVAEACGLNADLTSSRTTYFTMTTIVVNGSLYT